MQVDPAHGNHSKAHISAWVAMIAFVIASAVALSAFAKEGKRVAFVVGIDTYENLGEDKYLERAVSDAKAISKTLRALGYEVIEGIDVTLSDFDKKWQAALEKTSSEDILVFFFSGHGVEVDGENFLLPRDIPYFEYGRQKKFQRNAVSVTELLNDLKAGHRKPPKVTVMILDACRDNPTIPPQYRTKGMTFHGGLAKVPQTKGTFILYAAEPGKLSLDRLGPNDTDPNSVFTRSLLPLLKQANLPIQNLAVQVKEQVHALTGNYEQVPEYTDGIIGQFCLSYCADQTKVGTDPMEHAGRTVDEDSLIIEELEKQYGQAIVYLSTRVVDQKGQELPPITGTGFIISENGYVITANSLIPFQTPDGYRTAGKTRVQIGSRFGTSLEAVLQDRILEHDLALLKIEHPPPNLSKMVIGDPNLVRNPDSTDLYWAGFPGPEDLSIRKGRLQSLSSTVSKAKWVAQIDGTQGDYGGPIFIDGNVVAVAQSTNSTTQKHTYLAPIIYADPFFETLNLWTPWKGRQRTIAKLAARSRTITNSRSTAAANSEVKLKELFDVREHQNNIDKSVRAFRYKFFEVGGALFSLKKHFSSNDLANSLDALALGDAVPASQLLKKVAVTHDSDAGKAGYMLGTIAEINVEYWTALNWYKSALSKPAPQAEYFDAAASMAHKIGDHANALTWAKQSLELRRSQIKGNEPDYAAALCAVGLLLVESNPNEAIHNCEEAVTVFHKHSGQELRIAGAYDTIGASYEFAGNFEKAEGAYRKALDISERVSALPGGLEARKQFANTSNNLAGLYRGVGRHRDSVSLTENAISINETIYGKDHPRLGIDLVGLGNIHLALGDYGLAKGSFERGYGLLKSAMGRKNRLVATTLMYMAPLASIQKKNKKAIEIATDALAVFQEVFGKGNSVYEMQTRMILAELKSIEGKFGEAREELNRSEKILKSKYETRVDDMFRIGLLRAATQLRQSQLSEASMSLEAAQHSSMHIADRYNPLWGEYLLLKGKLHAKSNRLRDAEEALEKAQEIFNVSLGATHLKRGETLTELASVQRSMHKDVSLQTYALARKILADHPDIRTVTAIDLTL